MNCSLTTAHSGTYSRPVTITWHTVNVSIPAMLLYSHNRRLLLKASAVMKTQPKQTDFWVGQTVTTLLKATAQRSHGTQCKRSHSQHQGLHILLHRPVWFSFWFIFLVFILVFQLFFSFSFVLVLQYFFVLVLVLPVIKPADEEALMICLNTVHR